LYITSGVAAVVDLAALHLNKETWLPCYSSADYITSCHNRSNTLLAEVAGKIRNMKKIKSQKQLEIDESYLVFVGYHYSPSGFDIGTFNLGGNFEMQANGDRIPFTEQLEVFTLPLTEG
jgi:hypothetical protein